MKYCRRCILPDTRPNVFLNEEGICSACVGHDDKEHLIDWQDRRLRFEEMVEEAKSKAASYDCIVPVSGGKDSWYQVIRCQEYGMNVLGVTWRTPGRTALGQQNLDAMIRNLGIDHIDYTIDPDVERRFMKAAYQSKGATGIPMHMALFAIPIRLAAQLRVPMMVWGENPQLEFGGTEAERLATDLDPDWVRSHGVTNQTGPEDWVGQEGLTAADLVAYQLPADDAFDFSPRSVFLGSFFKWNSVENVEMACARGFQVAEEARTGTWHFADVDCHFISLHHLLKWYKFGITRAFDNLSVQIRYGSMTREAAIQQLGSIGLQIPTEDIAKFCTFVGESEAWFWRVAEQHRNLDIWEDHNGTWRIRNFLIEDWDWGVREDV